MRFSIYLSIKECAGIAAAARKSTSAALLVDTLSLIMGIVAHATLGVMSSRSGVNSWVMIIVSTGEYSGFDLGCEACLTQSSAVTHLPQRLGLLTDRCK